jgi:hypothetical protein
MTIRDFTYRLGSPVERHHVQNVADDIDAQCVLSDESERAFFNEIKSDGDHVAPRFLQSIGGWEENTLDLK